MVLAQSGGFGRSTIKQKLTPRWVIIKLTGMLFAAYAAFIIFLIARDGGRLLGKEIVIYVVVALLFGVLAVFSWTSEFKNMRFLMVRRIAFIIDLLAILFLKLRMVFRYAAAVDFSRFFTVLYGGAYFLTLGALMTLIIYFVFVLKTLPRHLIASVVLPILALLLFVGGFAMEMILFCKYNIGMEGNALRTLTSRPVFYLSFIGLSVYFLFPPQILEPLEGMQLSKADGRDYII